MDRGNMVIALLALVFLLWFVGVVVERSNGIDDCHRMGGPRAVYRYGHCWAPDEHIQWRAVDAPWEKKR